MSFQNNTLHPAFEAMDNLFGYFIQEIDNHHAFLKTGIKPYVNLESVYNGIVRRNELFEVPGTFVSYKEFRQTPFVLSQESFSSFIAGVWEKIKEFFKKIFGFIFGSKGNSIDSKIAQVRESGAKVEEFAKSIHHVSNKKVTVSDAPRLVHHFSGIKGAVDVTTLMDEVNYVGYISEVIVDITKELGKDLEVFRKVLSKDGNEVKSEVFNNLELPDLASTSYISKKLSSNAPVVNNAARNSYYSLSDPNDSRKDVSDSIIPESIRRVMISHKTYVEFAVHDKLHGGDELNKKWLKLPYSLLVTGFTPDGKEHNPDLDLNMFDIEVMSKTTQEVSSGVSGAMKTFSTELKHLESEFTSIENQVDALLKLNSENKNLRTYMQLIRGFLSMIHGLFAATISVSGRLNDFMKALISIDLKAVGSKKAS